jgi:hypothetical protein
MNATISPDLLWSIGGITGLLVLVYFGWRIIDKEKKSRMQ